MQLPLMTPLLFPTFSFSGSAPVFPEGWVFSRASSATYYDAVGVLQTAGSGVARFDYNPATLAPRGLLIEESRTNLLLNSSNTSGAGWASFGSPTITSNNAGAPDGTATFNKWTRTSTAATYTQQTSTKAASSLPYTFSIFAKAGTSGRYLAVRLQGIYPNRADTCFDLQDGVIISSTTGGAGFTNTSRIEPIGGGVYRCTVSSITSDTHTSVTGIYSFNTNAGQIDTTGSAASADGYVWGAQLEQAPFGTSYIPTGAATATRAADICYTTNLPWFNAAAGTFMTEYMLGGGVGNTTRVQASLNDGSINNRVQFYNQNAVDTFDARSGGSLIWSQYINSAVTANTVMKIAMSYADGAYRGTQNGATPVSQASGALPTGINRLDIGNRNYVYQLNGWLRSFKYWNRALPAQQMQMVTK